MCQNKIETACPIIQMLLDERKEEEEKNTKTKESLRIKTKWYTIIYTCKS